MAKNRGGKDSPLYKGGGGRIQASPSFANDDGFGTPPAPGERGEAYGGEIADGLRTPGKYGGFDKFHAKKGGRK
jgi:hypothetical protein